MLLYAGFVLLALVLGTAEAQEGNFWETETQTCVRYGRTGDCAFYGIPCLEKKFDCKVVGFPVGYGYRFCSKIVTHYEEFDADGKAWIDDVKKCLTKALIPIYKSKSYTCPLLKTFGMDTYPVCFAQAKGGGGICKVIRTNREALQNVWGASGTQGEDSSTFLEQLLVTAQHCMCSYDLAELHQVVGATKDVYTKVLDLSTTHWQKTPDEGIQADCESKALQGDCAFYDCLERRWPCGRTKFVQREGQPLCEKLKKKAPVFTPAGQEWVTKFTKCMTRSLLPAYKAESLSCRYIHNLGFRTQYQCFIDTDICDLIENRQDDFAAWYVFDVVSDWRFHQELSTILCRCHKFEGGTRYKLKFSSLATTQLKQKAKVVDQSSSADSQCTSQGGKCQDYSVRTCTAGYEDNKCGGNALRKCCLACDSSCESNQGTWSAGDSKCSNAGGQCKMDSNYCHGEYQTEMCGGPAGRKCCVPG
ncbi:uncharacterized protein [Branchiostoma lanceolatum]|uniref:uncharacterized protein n=1 Tax=Branchiostoma lanceolatum TaxID=7740 RepID=UPI0034535DA0